MSSNPDPRNAALRPPALAGRVYPANPALLAAQLEQWLAAAPPPPADATLPAGPVAGVVSPHIDYFRGAATYAGVWQRARAAVEAADLILVFGTDHQGWPGSITPTYQQYTTPRGALATDPSVVDALVDALGVAAAFAQGNHHQTEHSVELAAVWIQHLLAGRPTPVVPILVGSFQPFTHGTAAAATYPPFGRAIEALHDATRGRRVIVVAAADLAHVGPAFGDPAPLNGEAKERGREADAALLAALATGDPELFLRPIVAEQDARRICGMPPIYLTLRYLGQSLGTITGYEQCPADAGATSIVSIAGAVLYAATPSSPPAAGSGRPQQ